MSDVAAIDAAARVLAPAAVRTPLLESPLLNKQVGYRLLIKPEVLQHTGSFKFRGAYNRLAHLTREQQERGVVAYSSGNHGQGVAAAARLRGLDAVIVMPADAPEAKICRTRAWGAEVVLYDRCRQDREQVAEALAAERGATLVPPFDDPLVIAGQGTTGLELAEQALALGVTLDAVLVPCGGGGLIAGVAVVIADRSPRTRVLAVEPEDFDDTVRSLTAGRRVANPAGGHTICDALMVQRPGALTFPINRALLAGGVTVDDHDTLQAMAAAFRHFRLVVEPGGAVALAAVLAGRFRCDGGVIAVICSGGNVDADLFCRAIRGI